MNQKTALLIGILLTVTIQVQAQNRKVLFEEVKKRPITIAGEWLIGNKNMIVDSNSQIASASEIKTGSLAVTEYLEVGDKIYVTRMQPYPIRASEINDGPYVNWLDPQTAEIITIVNGKTSRLQIEKITEPRVIKQLTPRVQSLTLDPASPSPSKSEWEQPSRLMAISDLEGNYLNTVRFLENNKVIDTGEILFANLKLSGQDNSLYYFDKENVEGHYDKNGKSVQKALMKTPINGARLSSSFGMRKHPIDGFNKMHRGTDFAAPKGTPIMASGNGIIQKAGWCGGGGNCVKIRHNSTYETVYAHMSKFARGIKKGVRVKQGQTIGYVGSTGKSTGPHLHYEVIVNGKKVNSQKLKLPSGKVLKGKNRELFETNKIKLNVLKSEKIIGLN